MRVIFMRLLPVEVRDRNTAAIGVRLVAEVAARAIRSRFDRVS
jgi:hypothetical protein